MPRECATPKEAVTQATKCLRSIFTACLERFDTANFKPCLDLGNSDGVVANCFPGLMNRRMQRLIDAILVQYVRRMLLEPVTFLLHIGLLFVKFDSAIGEFDDMYSITAISVSSVWSIPICNAAPSGPSSFRISLTESLDHLQPCPAPPAELFPNPSRSREASKSYPLSLLPKFALLSGTSITGTQR